MQTFLPYSNFEASAKVLDYRRLGKQRVECLQILNVMTDPSKGWGNHPATKMWQGHGAILVEYGLAITREWISRGYKDTCYAKIESMLDFVGEENSLPSWLGDNNFHISHRSNLVRKFPEHYKVYWPEMKDDLPYIWPV